MRSHVSVAASGSCYPFLQWCNIHFEKNREGQQTQESGRFSSLLDLNCFVLINSQLDTAFTADQEPRSFRLLGTRCLLAKKKNHTQTKNVFVCVCVKLCGVSFVLAVILLSIYHYLPSDKLLRWMGFGLP